MSLKRLYRIVSEKKDSEGFTRFIPQYIYENMLNVDRPKWKVVPYDSEFLRLNHYVKSKEEAMDIIDNFEKEYQDIENKSTSVEYYTPNLSD